MLKSNICICVKKTTFFEKIFNTKGWADCKVNCESITEAVKRAIQTLQ